MRQTDSEQLLGLSLRAAVPLWCQKVAAYTPDGRTERAMAAADVVGCYGDVLQFGRKKKGGAAVLRDIVGLQVEKNRTGDAEPFKPSPSPAEVFNALAEGCAIMQVLTGVDAIERAGL